MFTRQDQDPRQKRKRRFNVESLENRQMMDASGMDNTQTNMLDSGDDAPVAEFETTLEDKLPSDYRAWRLVESNNSRAATPIGSVVMPKSTAAAHDLSTVIENKGDWEKLRHDLGPELKLPNVDFSESFVYSHSRDAADPNSISVYVEIGTNEIARVSSISTLVAPPPSDAEFTFYAIDRNGVNGVEFYDPQMGKREVIRIANPDNADKIGVHREGSFHRDVAGQGALVTPADPVQFGAVDDTPIVGDWNGDGKDDVGVHRGSNATFYRDMNGNGIWDGPEVDSAIRFGIVGDTPLTGDWNGDGKDDIGVYRESSSRFYRDTNGNGRWDGSSVDSVSTMGALGDTPITGDWNGDGKDDIGVYRGATNRFYRDVDGNGIWDSTSVDRVDSFGTSGDTPIIGDWNGDGKDDIGVHRSNQFYVDFNGNGQWDGITNSDVLFEFGLAGDTPIAGKWDQINDDHGDTATSATPIRVLPNDPRLFPWKSGEIESPGDVDMFSFEAEKGQTYSFAAWLDYFDWGFQPSHLDDPIVTLYAEDGSTVLAEGRNISWVADRNATFYVSVKATDGNSTGGYHWRRSSEIRIGPDTHAALAVS